VPPVADPAKAIYFNYSQLGHHSKACPNPSMAPRIQEIKLDIEALGDKVINKDDTESESEN
jgi:hypothetical protein